MFAMPFHPAVPVPYNITQLLQITPYFAKSNLRTTMNPRTAYSSTPLAKKLGIKEGFIVRLVNEPLYYHDLFTDMPANITFSKSKTAKKNFIHYFTEEAKQLYKDLPSLKEEIVDNGIIWISWPKKASKVPTDITEDTIRDFALQIGLVDIKVCAVDEVWSGLKLVIPVKDRKQ